MLKIGIDPDVDKNGVAIKNGDDISLYNLKFFELFDKLKDLENENVKVFIECGELNQTIYKVKTIPKSVRNIKQYCANIGSRVGKNFAAAILIIQMCEYLGLDYAKVKPSSRKIDAKTLKALTGISKRTNQEQRDALMLILGR